MLLSKGEGEQSNNKNSGRHSSRPNAGQHNTLYDNLEHVKMQPEDKRDRLTGELPFMLFAL